jgi:tetratricopeptide (TPR) repeat protein
MMNRPLIALVLLVALIGFAGGAVAQEPFARAKALYDDAMYDEALRVLDGLANQTIPEIHQYRALCLIALGRADAADREIAIVVGADPFFTPDSESVSPRVLSMFSAARHKLLPPMVRRTFAEATALFKDGHREQAIHRFDEVLRLLDDVDLKDDQSLTDLRLVASAFVELVRVQPQAQQPLPSRMAIEPVATPAPPESIQRKPIDDTRSPAVTRPVAIAQVLPLWKPPDEATARRVFTGAIKLSIDAQGKVTEATQERIVHPAYDPIVLQAARSWLYKPATLDGQPVRSETTVEIRLEPRTN